MCYAQTSILLMVPSFSTIGSNPIFLKIASRNLPKLSSPSAEPRTPMFVSRTYALPSSSFSCSAAGSYSSSLRASSLSVESSASRFAAIVSASLIALARDNWVRSSSFIIAAWPSSDGTDEGLVQDIRAASNTRVSAIQGFKLGFFLVVDWVGSQRQRTFEVDMGFFKLFLSFRFRRSKLFFCRNDCQVILVWIHDRQHITDKGAGKRNDACFESQWYKDHSASGLFSVRSFMDINHLLEKYEQEDLKEAQK